MNKDITMYEREVIIGAMHNLLEVKITPYPFPEFSKFFIRHKRDPNKAENLQKLNFYQVFNTPDSIKYLDKPITITMVDQRNKSSNKS